MVDSEPLLMTSAVQSQDPLVMEGKVVGGGAGSPSPAGAALPGDCGSGLAGQCCASQLGAPGRVGGGWGEWVSSLAPHISSSEHGVTWTPLSLAVSRREDVG